MPMVSSGRTFSGRVLGDAMRFTGISFQNMGRELPQNAAGAMTTAGNMIASAIELPANILITSLAWFSGSTAQTLGTTPHYWIALFDSSRALLRQSTDNTARAIAANSLIQDNLSSTFTTTYSGLHYIGIMVNSGGGAGVQPTFSNAPLSNGLVNQAPRITALDSTVYTTTAPNPFLLSANMANWAWVGAA